ncbi:agmatinase [Candidatus Woesearchaeota archaeon]|nr:agmatinase [Candidatus Woesearchaeota archaeon]
MEYVKEPHNFAEIPDIYSNYANSKAVILPFPYEKTTCYIKGTEKGPAAIIKASAEMELYDEEMGNIFEAGICTLKELKVAYAPEEMAEIGCKNIKNLLNDNKFVVTLGGEHSITSGIAKAFREKYNELSVLQIDAHADLREDFEGSRHSHACAMKRTGEICPVVQIGIRSLSFEESELIKEKKLKIFWAKDIVDSDKWFDEAISMLSKNVYITFDLDGLDPSIMPSVGTPEPGGLGYYQVLRFLKKVCSQRNVVGFDVVELCPNEKEISSDFTAAKLVYKLIGYKFHNFGK